MKTDINGVPWTYENKDILAFDEPTIENNHTDLLDRLKEETIPELKKHMKWYTSKDAAKNWEEWS